MTYQPLIVATFLVVAFAQSSLQAAEAKRVRILMLGDSVTALGMPEATVAMLNGPPPKKGEHPKAKIRWETINCGVGGETAAGGASRIAALLDKEKPEIVTISYGLNDTWHDEGGEVFRKNMMAIVQIVQSHESKPRLILLTSTPFDDSRHFLGKEKKMIDRGGPDKVLETQYNVVTRELAVELGVGLIDMHRYFYTDKNWPRFMEPDGVHPNKEGLAFAGPEVAISILAWYATEVEQQPDALKTRDKAKEKLEPLTDPELKPKDKSRILDDVWHSCPYLPEGALAWHQFTYPETTMQAGSDQSTTKPTR